MTENLCRVCLVPEENIKFKSIFNKNDNLQQAIEKLGNFKLNRSNTTSDLICPRCYDELKKATNFQKLLIQSNEHFQDDEMNSIEEFNSIEMAIIKEEPIETEILFKCPRCDFQTIVELEFLQHLNTEHLEVNIPKSCQNELEMRRNRAFGFEKTRTYRKVTDEVRFDQIGHMITLIELNKRWKCRGKTCRANISTKCFKCDVGLCVKCFKDYHEK